MVQGGKDLGFAFEARDAVAVAGKHIRENFQRDITPKCNVTRSIHFTHATGAKGGDNLVGAEPGTRREGHVTGSIRAGRRCKPVICNVQLFQCAAPRLGSVISTVTAGQIDAVPT